MRINTYVNKDTYSVRIFIAKFRRVMYNKYR